jgi:structural maintenance of chromosome 2
MLALACTPVPALHAPPPSQTLERDIASFSKDREKHIKAAQDKAKKAKAAVEAGKKALRAAEQALQAALAEQEAAGGEREQLDKQLEAAKALVAGGHGCSTR